MIRIPVTFALYSTYGWVDFEASLEEQNGRAVLVVPEDPARKDSYQGVYVPEQRFPDFWNDADDPRFANVEPTHESGIAYKQITVMSPSERGGEPKPRPVKAFPYIHSTSVALTHLHLVQQPTKEEREWLATKAFPETEPHFSPGHQTIEWVFGAQEAKSVARVVYDIEV
jgi:hypothetical protein